MPPPEGLADRRTSPDSAAVLMGTMGGAPWARAPPGGACPRPDTMGAMGMAPWAVKKIEAPTTAPVAQTDVCRGADYVDPHVIDSNVESCTKI